MEQARVTFRDGLGAHWFICWCNLMRTLCVILRYGSMKRSGSLMDNVHIQAHWLCLSCQLSIEPLVSSFIEVALITFGLLRSTGGRVLILPSPFSVIRALSELWKCPCTYLNWYRSCVNSVLCIRCVSPSLSCPVFSPSSYSSLISQESSSNWTTVNRVYRHWAVGQFITGEMHSRLSMSGFSNLPNVWFFISF